MFFRRNKEEKEDDEIKKPSRKREKEDDGLEWDKKRIVITLFFGVVAILVAIELKNMFLPDTKILGESTVKTASEIEKPGVEAPDINLESRVRSRISGIKENIVNLDPEEVASSSPQIQKVLRDIQGIKDLPADQARNTCMRICSGI